MLELNAASFLGAATQIARVRQILESVEGSPSKDEVFRPEIIGNMLAALEAFHLEAQQIGAKLACVAADRLGSELRKQPCTITLGQFSRAIADIESRFADQLGFIKLFVIDEQRAVLFKGASELLSEQTTGLYPSIWFDCEESAKCLCLGRSVASVFHSMRMLEIALGSISARLGVPDPSKATDRSWGNMLRSIKTKMDELHPPRSRLPGSEGSKLEAVYVSLDAVKNPWRNGTMHVDAVYTEEEARHILVCTSHLFDKMSAIFDETGADAPSGQLALANPHVD